MAWTVDAPVLTAGGNEPGGVSIPTLRIWRIYIIPNGATGGSIYIGSTNIVLSVTDAHALEGIYLGGMPVKGEDIITNGTVGGPPTYVILWE